MAIGIERQWSGHATGPRARFAGLRTFALLGAAAGIVGWLWTNGVYALAAVLLGACAALVVVAYARASQQDVDATTEASAIVVLAAGTLAGLGFLALASAIVATTALILVEKSRLHALVQRLDDQALRAAARFAVMAAVVLPLLPAGPYPPFDTFRPRELWLLVLLFSGLSFTGYFARRAVGPRQGYLLTGLLGGLISSTSVSLTFSRASHRSPELGRPLAYGVIAACTVLFIRVGLAVTLLNGALGWRLIPYLLPPFVVGTIAVTLGLRHGRDGLQPVDSPGNPLELGAALQMAVLFQVVLTTVELVRRGWGDTGIIVSGAVLGLTDVDALTLTMARGSQTSIPLDVAARGLAVGILSNTVMKLGITTALGSPPFRRTVAFGLAAMLLAMSLPLILR